MSSFFGGRAHYHLPGIFEFIDLYEVFIPLFYEHDEFFYEWCDIGSLYGAPSGVLWGGGRIECSSPGTEKRVLELSEKYGIPVNLAFSNSLLDEKCLEDRKCNELCRMFSSEKNGIIIHSDMLLGHIQSKYPKYHFISSTTKVLTSLDDFFAELNRSDFTRAVPDFRLNRKILSLDFLTVHEKGRVEFLCNECCDFGCARRKECYESVSRKMLGCDDGFSCLSPGGNDGYVFSRAMKNPGFIGTDAILQEYLPRGFSNFKLEGRSLGSALMLEILLYYMVKPSSHLEVREKIYLDNTLDLF